VAYSNDSPWPWWYWQEREKKEGMLIFFLFSVFKNNIIISTNKGKERQKEGQKISETKQRFYCKLNISLRNIYKLI